MRLSDPTSLLTYLHCWKNVEVDPTIRPTFACCEEREHELRKFRNFFCSNEMIEKLEWLHASVPVATTINLFLAPEDIRSMRSYAAGVSDSKLLSFLYASGYFTAALPAVGAKKPNCWGGDEAMPIRVSNREHSRILKRVVLDHYKKKYRNFLRFIPPAADALSALYKSVLNRDNR